MVNHYEYTLLKEFDFEPIELKKGYANRTLYVNVETKEVEIRPVSDRMKDVFVGGKGFDLWLLWNAVNMDTKWDSPENEICIASGPMGGIPVYPGSGKSIVVSISPLTGAVIDSNVGGHFGPYLKYAGFDALEVQGKAARDVVIFIDGENNRVTIEEVPDDFPDAAHEITDVLVHRIGGEKPQWISAVTAGTGAKHTLVGCLNFSWYDGVKKVNRMKQAGRGGIGSVFRDKKIKAIVARGTKPTLDKNQPDDKELVTDVARKHSNEGRTLDQIQNKMSSIGTPWLVPIMDDYDLLPTNNYKFGSHPEAKSIGAEVFEEKFAKGFDGCWIGCSMACSHGIKGFVPRTGPYAGQEVFVDGPEYETIAGVGSNCGIFDPEAIIEINFYCDIYGLDTISIGTGMAFVMECYECGLINKEHTGGLELNFGNSEAFLRAIHQMAGGEGFGVLVGQGIRRMKKVFAEKYGADPAFMEDIGMEAKGLEYSEYMTKESLAQQGGYGMALKGPQHDEAWLIFLDQVKNLMPTFEQKAEALHWFPCWRTWFGLCGLCKLPWNDVVPEDNDQTPEPAKVRQHLEWYASYFQGVTGRQVSPDDLISISEKVYNFQRVFNVKMGYGRREHDDIPYRSMGPVTVEEYESRQDRYDTQLKDIIDTDPAGLSSEEKVKMLREYREDRYEKLKDAVYKRRGWGRNGVPLADHIKKMGIDFPGVLKTVEPFQEPWE
jgi:aldehyde:ferredoxin oxidoreductase